MKRSVLVIVQHFYPDIAAAGQVLTELAEDLVKLGRRVKVITGQPGYDPTSRRRAPSHEEYRGIKIRRLAYLRASKNRLVGRFLSYVSFLVACCGYLLFVSHRDYDSVLLASSPPIMSVLGVLLKRIYSMRFTFLVHDLYPDLAIALGITRSEGISSRIMNWITQTALRGADKVVLLSHDVERRILARGISAEKLVVIPNWADGTLVPGLPTTNTRFRREQGLVGKFVVLYTGNLGLYYDLQTVLDAASLLKPESDICFILVGEGGEKASLVGRAEAEKLSNVRFFPYQPAECYSDLLHTGDALLLTLAGGIEEISVPSKTYKYLAARRPIVAVMAPKSEIAAMIRDEKCGISVSPGDGEGLAQAILRLRDDPGLRETAAVNARRLFERKFDRALVTARFCEVL